uniref:DNA-dependent protein kinase catalytic subunit n=1 Tax=Anthurium amnicola TaxID=1678845 RepID=A0A1D1Z4F5_9ARAE
MRKVRRAPVGASLPPPSPYPMGGEDARAWFKLQNLMQDYEELLKDTATKRKRLQMAKRKVVKLTDEVKFLRRRYKFLMKNASPTSYRVKTHPQKTHNSLKHKDGKSLAGLSAQPQSKESGGQFHQHDRTYRGNEIALPRTSAILDLNQISLPEGEEAEFQVPWETLPTELSNRYLPEGDAPGSDLKLSVCRDARSGASRTGKRKVSWRDQVALKV